MHNSNYPYRNIVGNNTVLHPSLNPKNLNVGSQSGLSQTQIENVSVIVTSGPELLPPFSVTYNKVKDIKLS